LQGLAEMHPNRRKGLLFLLVFPVGLEYLIPFDSKTEETSFKKSFSDKGLRSVPTHPNQCRHFLFLSA